MCVCSLVPSVLTFGPACCVPVSRELRVERCQTCSSGRILFRCTCDTRRLDPAHWMHRDRPSTLTGGGEVIPVRIKVTTTGNYNEIFKNLEKQKKKEV